MAIMHGKTSAPTAYLNQVFLVHYLGLLGAVGCCSGTLGIRVPFSDTAKSN